jgi:GT2 family glycosyltransferase
MAAEILDLSIVLVNWNACEMTSAALESIRLHTREISYEIFVTDNGSTRDQSATELPRRFPAIQFIPNNGNMGFSIANNQGIARARGRYVLLLNNDTVQTENALGAAVAYMDTHPEVGGLGIQHRNADAGRSEQPSVGFPTWREVGSLIGI